MRSYYIALALIFVLFQFPTHSRADEDEGPDFIDQMDMLDRVEENRDELIDRIEKERNDTMKADGRWNELELKCSKAFKMFETSHVTIAPYMGDKENPAGKGRFEDNQTCHQHFHGDHKCTVELECSVIDLRLNPLTNTCDDDENFRISDGIEGEETYCNATKLLVRPRGQLRDLYVRILTRPSKKFARDYAGYKCTARCMKKSSKARELAKGFEAKTLPNCVCGVAHERDRIVGGKDASFNEFPWQAAIVKHATRKPACGGSLINDKYVLTAAHCFALAGVKAQQIDVLLHAHLLDAKYMPTKEEKAAYGAKGWWKAPGYDLEKTSDADEDSIRFEVDEIINHPLFNTKYDYDVALLRLNRRVDFAKESDVSTICIPDHSQYATTYEGENATVVGWGLAHELAASSTRLLQKLDIPIVNFDKCKGFIKKAKLTDRMFCAGFLQGTQDACKGDSGGPFLLKKNGQSTQIGIVSWGEGCARENSPGIYSKMTELVQWIQYHTQDAKYCEKAYTPPATTEKPKDDEYEDEEEETTTKE